MFLNFYKEDGLIALITVLVIALVVLFVAISPNLLNIGQAQMILKKEKSSVTFYLASACAEHALLQLKNDFAGYGGNEVLTINGESCKIEPVDTGVSPRIVKAWAEVENKIRRIEVEVRKPIDDLIIDSWQEVPDF